MARLTKAQRDLLQMVSHRCFNISGLSINGPREFRVAKALDRKGLATLDVFDQLLITDAGRAALVNGEASDAS